MYTQCEDLQEKLMTAWESSRTLQADRSPFLEFITSDANRNGINQVINPGGGKSKTLNLVYTPPILESTVSTQSDRACREGAGRADKVATYELDTNVVYESSEAIAIADLTRVCSNNDAFVAERLAQHFVAIDQKVASVIASQANALVGDYSADVVSALSLANPDDLVVSTLASGQYKAGALELIQWAAEASGFPNIVQFGGRLINEHVRLALAGCCTQWGIDVSALLAEYGFASAYDRRVAAALGSVSTKSLIFQPGALQLLTYTENEGLGTIGSFEMSSGNGYFTAFTPAGVPVDVTIVDRCKNFTIQVQTSAKLVGLPSDMFLTGDNQAGVTGVGKVTVSNS